MAKEIDLRVAVCKNDLNFRLHSEFGPALEVMPVELIKQFKTPDAARAAGHELTEEVNYMKCYYWHGLSVPHGEYAKKAGLPEDIADLIFHTPEKLTANYIDRISNVEIRRVALERMGFDNYMAQADVDVLHTDVDNLGRMRKLVRRHLDNDETITGVFVTNSTPNGKYEFEQISWVPLDTYAEHEQKRIFRKYEATGDLKEVDGKLCLRVVKEGGKFIPETDEKGNLVYKQYFLQVHPQLRPMYATGEYDQEGDQIMKYGKPQELTCHNAVASTFGLYGDEYELDCES